MNRIVGDGEFGSATRQRIFKLTLLAIASIFILRLGWLQIIEGGAYRLRAEAQAIKQIKNEPFRGMMFDRTGRAIVQNIASFTVSVTPNAITPEAITKLARILGVSDSAVTADVEKARKYNRFNPAKLASGRDINRRIVAAIEENRESLPGVSVVVEGKRHYAFNGNAAHLLGYVREVSERQLTQLGDAYDPGDVAGQSGLEKAYERDIRGQKGLEFIAVNNRGQRIASFNDGMSDAEPREGFDLYLGLDVELQTLGEELLEGRRGGIVALDPNNGEILAFISKPDYDPRLLAGQTPKGFMTWLMTDKEKPSFNRVSQPAYPPGSTWKMLVAIGCLQEGLITPSTQLVCTGAYHYGNRSMACHGAHGGVAVERAIQVSCNSFFAQCGVKLGADGMAKYGALFGFGTKTNVDVSYERSGLVPSTEYMDKRYGKRGWSKYAAANWGIGQGEILVTPLQMARYTAAIANGGILYQPHAVTAIYNKVLDRVDYVRYDSVNLGINPEYISKIQQGMFLVVNQAGGTATRQKIDSITICGKTGTAQNAGDDHSWFIAYAPKDNPQIAICVMVENAGFGGTIAAPMARKMIDFYLTGTLPTDVKEEEYGVPDTTQQQKLRDTIKLLPVRPRGPFLSAKKP